MKKLLKDAALGVAITLGAVGCGHLLISPFITPAMSATGADQNTMLLRQIAGDIHCVRMRLSGIAC